MIWIWIAGGGALGAVARVLLASWIGRIAHEGMPLGILMVNLVGCGLMGAAFVLIDRFEPTPAVRQFVTAGLLGAFTTFSSFALEAYHLVIDGRATLALGYVMSSVVGGVIALLLGIALTEWGLSH